MLGAHCLQWLAFRQFDATCWHIPCLVGSSHIITKALIMRLFLALASGFCEAMLSRYFKIDVQRQVLFGECGSLLSCYGLALDLVLIVLSKSISTWLDTVFTACMWLSPDCKDKISRCEYSYLLTQSALACRLVGAHPRTELSDGPSLGGGFLAC